MLAPPCPTGGPSALAALQVPRTQPTGAAPDCQHSPHEHPGSVWGAALRGFPPALGWAPVPGTTFLPAPVTARCLCSAAQCRRSRGSPGQVREILFGSQGIRVENLSDFPEISPPVPPVSPLVSPLLAAPPSEPPNLLQKDFPEALEQAALLGVTHSTPSHPPHLRDSESSRLGSGHPSAGP